MFGIGWTEILVVLVVALLVLGPKKLPEIAKGLGRGLRDFRKAMSGLDLDDPPERAPVSPQPPPPTATPKSSERLMSPPETTDAPADTPEPSDRAHASPVDDTPAETPTPPAGTPAEALPVWPRDVPPKGH